MRTDRVLMIAGQASDACSVGGSGKRQEVAEGKPMGRVVCIHGIAQELKSRERLLAEWSPSLCGGVSNAGGRLDPADVDMAFYGILFRVPGSKDNAAIPNYKPGDLEDPLEIALVEEMYAATGQSIPSGG